MAGEWCILCFRHVVEGRSQSGCGIGMRARSRMRGDGAGRNGGMDFATADLEDLIGREWLTVNGIGGYASSTVPGMNTRKYHGLLVAAMAPPVRRMVLLSRVEETVYHNGWPFALACNEYPGAIHPVGYEVLKAFSHDPVPR